MAEKKMNRYVSLLLTLILSMAVGAVFMLVIGYHPIEAYVQLFKGAFVGTINLGTTLQKFAPILLTGVGFAIAAKVGCFAAGIEGNLYLGAIAAAWAGHYIKGTRRISFHTIIEASIPSLAILMEKLSRKYP